MEIFSLKIVKYSSYFVNFLFQVSFVCSIWIVELNCVFLLLISLRYSVNFLSFKLSKFCVHFANVVLFWWGFTVGVSSSICCCNEFQQIEWSLFLAQVFVEFKMKTFFDRSDKNVRKKKNTSLIWRRNVLLFSIDFSTSDCCWKSMRRTICVLLEEFFRVKLLQWEFPLSIKFLSFIRIGDEKTSIGLFNWREHFFSIERRKMTVSHLWTNVLLSRVLDKIHREKITSM